MPSPIRLYELAATTAPLISSRVAAVELKLPATIVLRSVTAAVFCAKPPPAPAPLLSLSAVLLVIGDVGQRSVAGSAPWSDKIGPTAVVVGVVARDRAVGDVDRALIAGGGDTAAVA